MFEQSKYGGGSGTKERKLDEMGWGGGPEHAGAWRHSQGHNGF